jgi:LmbE family N-acetylglucosaminyl deacetylase
MVKFWFAGLLAVASAACAAQSISQPGDLNPSAYPLPMDRGAAGLWQSLQKLNTRASLMMIVAHPDDEDGGMLAYEGRGHGVDTTLLTLTRGEGGQNVITGDFWDELGLLRTQELLAAGDLYGTRQRFAREADFGFSKSLDEALKTWGHDRVLYDVVRQIRITRPLVVCSVFAGNISDGHGHHQVAGLMAQDAYKLAGDPSVFPDQIAAGLQPWSPLKVYERVPFARVGPQGIFDYATGHYAPARFKNYVTGEWIEGVPSATAHIPVGTYNPLFGRSYFAVAREGLAEQKSQNDGVGVPLPRPIDSAYHLYASRAQSPLPAQEASLFDGIDISLAGIADLAPANARESWRTKLKALQSVVDEATRSYDAADPAKSAPALARGLTQTRTLLADVAASTLPADARANMTHELTLKLSQFNDALAQSLGFSLLALLEPAPAPGGAPELAFMRGNPVTPQTVTPGKSIYVNIHVADEGSLPITVDSLALVALSGDWKLQAPASGTGPLAPTHAVDGHASATVPSDAPPTHPYFARPTLEQSYYDIETPQDLGLPTSPYPLAARVLYTYAGVQAELNGVVQTNHSVHGIGPTLEPLLIAQPISITMSPQKGILPIGQDGVRVKALLHSSIDGPVSGSVRLELPQGWTATPAVAPFQLAREGEEKELEFEVHPDRVSEKTYRVTAVASSNGREYRDGYTLIGYPGIRPYPEHRTATLEATGINVKVAPGLRIGYIMGPGDEVPAGLEQLGVRVTQLTPQDLSTGSLAGFDAVVLGIRAYASRSELATHNNRLLDYVHAGGIVVVQYQTAEYNHNFGPYPITVPGDAEKVVEEDAKVKFASDDPLLSWPNQITATDFDGWVEERGHGFARTWAPEYVAPTEMHDVDQDPQRGGLLYARYGDGYYIYAAFAFFRQMPEGVPGAYRIIANMVSASRNPALKAHADSQTTP